MDLTKEQTNILKDLDKLSKDLNLPMFKPLFLDAKNTTDLCIKQLQEEDELDLSEEEINTFRDNLIDTFLHLVSASLNNLYQQLSIEYSSTETVKKVLKEILTYSVTKEIGAMQDNGKQE